MKTFILVATACLVAGCSSSSSPSMPNEEAGSPEGSNGEASAPSDGASPDGSGGYSLLHCPSGQTLPATCSSCIQTTCAAALASVGSACGAYFTCVCPTGADAGACGSPPRACSAALESLMNTCSSCIAICSEDAGAKGTGGDAGDGGGAESEAGAEGGSQSFDGGNDAGGSDAGYSDAAGNDAAGSEEGGGGEGGQDAGGG